MPETEKPKSIRPGMALALSGGGFRATLYHCGALTRLNELGLLSTIAHVSSVSGGSIAAGRLAVAWPRLKREGDRFTNLREEVIEPLRAFCRTSVDTPSVLWGSFLPGKSIGDVLAETYDEALMEKKTLQDLPETPRFDFNATNLQTGRLVRMSRRRIADYTIGEIRSPKVSLAMAVAASSAFPPVLSPVTLNFKTSDWTDFPKTRHFGDPAFTRALSLTDGGAYDNLGLEVVDSYRTIIVSDAGAPFSTEPEANSFWPKQALRALDIATDQARALRKRLLHATVTAPPGDRVYAYAGIDADREERAAYEVPVSLAIDDARVAALAKLRTRLDPFNPTEQGQLINWGWYMMDLAARGHVLKGSAAPAAWPEPGFPL
jgi:NTE family protein